MTSRKCQFAGEVVSFPEVFSEVSRGVRKFKQNQYAEQGAYPIIDQGQEAIAGYSDEETGLFIDVPAIVFGDHTRCIKYIDRPFFAGADGVKILKPRLPGCTRFWWHALKATSIENLGYSRHFKLLKAASFRVYDEARQREIVTRLDGILEQIAKVEQQIDCLESLVKSRFVEMFGDPMLGGPAWEKKRLGDIASVITGNTPSRKHPEYYGDFIEWVKTDNINTVGGIDEANERLSEEGMTKARVVNAGSILMACIAGSVESIGRVGLVDRRVAFNQQINAIVPGNRVLSEYLLWVFKLSKDYLCRDINMQLKGILNKTALSAKCYAVPPLELQREFTTFVRQADKLRVLIQQQKEKLQMLYDSLAQEYFAV